MSVELKPCPFCGGKPHSRTEIGLDGIGRFYWFECSTCRARSGEKFATETFPQFYEEVRDAWNRRTDLSQAAVAAALEAAAGVAREHGLAWVQHKGICSVIETAIRALITTDQHDALAAHVAAEVAKARAEDAATVLRYRPTGENAKHFVDVLVCDIANEILTGRKAK